MVTSCTSCGSKPVEQFNPFTPKGDQFQISLHPYQKYYETQYEEHWLFITYSDERWLCYQFSLPHLYISYLKGWANVPFELGSEGVKYFITTITASVRKATLRWNLTFCCMNTNLLTVSCVSVMSGVMSLPNNLYKCIRKYTILFSE